MDGRIAGVEIVMLVVLLAIWRLMVGVLADVMSFALVACQ